MGKQESKTYFSPAVIRNQLVNALIIPGKNLSEGIGRSADDHCLGKEKVGGNLGRCGIPWQNRNDTGIELQHDLMSCLVDAGGVKTVRER